jgi:hypothetical protein
MVDRASKAPSLFSSVSHLGRAVRDLFRTIKDKESSLATNAEAHHEEVETSLASRQNEPNSEVEELLPQPKPGWHVPVPSTLPVPTYAPVMIAFGIVFIALGAVTVWPLSIVGAFIFVFALAKWIGELLP